MMSLLGLISTLLTLYSYCLLGLVILSWLISFKVVNLDNRFVYSLYNILDRITEPALRRIRAFLTNFSGFYLSPVLLFILIAFANNLLWEYGPRLVQ